MTEPDRECQHGCTYDLSGELGVSYSLLAAVAMLALVIGVLVASRRSNAKVSGMLLRAAITGLLNPKVALFFLAFLPQFVNPDRGHVLIQFLVLGFCFAALGLLGDSVLATAAGRARARLLGHRCGCAGGNAALASS